MDTPSHPNAYERLLNDICVGMGFCGCIKAGKPLHVDDFIPKEGQVTADEFVDWVILADDMDLSLARKESRRAIRAAFVRRMGGETVDAARLRLSHKPS
jgi:hypothetical protein